MAIKTFGQLSGAYNFVFKKELEEILNGKKERLALFRKIVGNKNQSQYVSNGIQIRREILSDEEVIEVVN